MNDFSEPTTLDFTGNGHDNWELGTYVTIWQALGGFLLFKRGAFGCNMGRIT
jgi:hypothetical protein